MNQLGHLITEMTARTMLLVLFLGLLCTTYAQDFYVVTPATFRLNTDETIAVAFEDGGGTVVHVFIQDHPGKARNITHTTLEVQPDQPAVFKVNLDAANFPPNFLSSPGSPKLVSVTAATSKAHKEILVPITTKSGYVFIQTDKPIYTPNQRVQMRIMSLNEAAIPSDNIFKLQIVNPDGNIVEEKRFNEKTENSWKPFKTSIYKFPLYPVLGQWSATVLHGYEFRQNTTVHFDLQEYVLPTFTVELKAPDVILPTSDIISISVVAQYVYGKKVQGVVSFRIGIRRDGSQDIIYFATVGPKNLQEGFQEVRIETDALKEHRDIGWFPNVEGSQLVVEATVVDEATGNKEIATHIKTRFSKSPFVISFKRCLSDFKPGLNSIFEADITYVDGRPAENILTKIRAIADGKPMIISGDSTLSDENGKVMFEIHPEVTHSTISVTLETIDSKYEGSQATGHFTQRKFQSSNNAYISLARSTTQKLQPGQMFSKLIHFEPEGVKNIYYMIVSNGKIIDMQGLPPGQFKVQSLKFQITHEMVPYFRLVVFAHYGNEFIVDSLKVDVEKVCDPNAQVSVESVFNTQEPGAGGAINIRGTSGTWVGLLGVDEAVYALSKKDILSKAKMFDKLASHDLGCGPGGGLTVNQVLGNAGIIIGTNKYTPSPEHSCAEVKRRKRAAVQDIVSRYETKLERACCTLGLQYDIHNRNCQEKTDIVVRQLEGEYSNCSKAYLECCIYSEENVVFNTLITSRTTESRYDELDFIPGNQEDTFEKATSVRSDFRETWLFEDLRIGPEGRRKYEVSLPHSITTWVIGAVSISPQNGMCVTEPQKLVSFKKIFLHLNLPYSVVRNEQVEIQATIFNYGSKVLPANVYMYGVKDLCTGTQPGQKSERKYPVIQPNSAASVSFPVVPLKAQIFKIKVVALTPEGSDVIEKDLRVVPEGVAKEIDVSFKLDPSNQQQRKKRHIETKLFNDTIDQSQNLQVTSIKLAAPEGFVPGTASCSIRAMGDQMGPVLETVIYNPEGLLTAPGGCGEQNMIRMAPTLYAMKYLKTEGKLTAKSETKGYEFIRGGYANQLNFRMDDGSFKSFSSSRVSSTWLTAFVAKVFCQANELVYIDETVMCGAVRSLMNQQEGDGSFVEKSTSYNAYLMAGVKGSIPLTAFILITLEECKCEEQNLLLVKQRAIAFLEAHLEDVNEPLPVAIMAYALALSGSERKEVANTRLLSLAKRDDEENLMYWETTNSAEDIQTAGYGLLTQLLLDDMITSGSIVNWLNRRQKQSGSFKSTQDTVLALQSLSEYAIRAQMPRINLVTNITSSNDRNLHEVLTFHEDNALLLQDVKINKIGGTLFVNTVGHGVASLAVKLRYNLIVPPEQICKFDVTVDVLEAKQEEEDEEDKKTKKQTDVRDPSENDLGGIPLEVFRAVVLALDANIPAQDAPQKSTSPQGVQHTSQGNTENDAKSRARRQNQAQNSKIKYIISICAKYLGNRDTEMSIVDVGIFSGFEPDKKKLKELEEDPNHLIQKYEISSRGVVFYLEKIPIASSYCFSFPVIREYIVGNTQMSVIKVYDYYDPDKTCTKFYSPASNSPILRKICESGICQCAEGGCPSNQPLKETSSINKSQRRMKIIDMACENYDYVWRGKLDGPLKREGGFQNISFLVEQVVKEGIEKAKDIEGESRTLLSRDNCAEMFPGQTYLIMGKDGQQYKNSEGITWFRYLLDQTSIVHMWTPISIAKDRELQRVLDSMVKSLVKNGCLL